MLLRTKICTMFQPITWLDISFTVILLADLESMSLNCMQTVLAQKSLNNHQSIKNLIKLLNYENFSMTTHS